MLYYCCFNFALQNSQEVTFIWSRIGRWIKNNYISINLITIANYRYVAFKHHRTWYIDSIMCSCHKAHFYYLVDSYHLATSTNMVNIKLLQVDDFYIQSIIYYICIWWTGYRKAGDRITMTTVEILHILF